ncbi:DUF1499 domain-containing protein [Qipengyuania qiaonensis]|uniref:DUF1499 domain-containing protein n=1 Tax=Qipengyuania qiaonensis TaxID=2867240 RepID=A0ABS7J9Y5_9SPHN|nr:DUF1499 domain-containing protein [Qipengyuania qiaonensis]MBX7484071.1 DUF1499 domain-containing protein [Qipengyuania qiaonensis]
MNKTPWHSRLALSLAVLLPVYFAIAALGTKFGLWGWQTGLLFLTIKVGPILLGTVALIALVSLVVSLIRKPKAGWLLSLVALLVPVGIFGTLAYVRSLTADIPPIHDIATDVEDPPVFSQATLDIRSAEEANPLNDYRVPLGELEMWAEIDTPLADQSHAQVIGQAYPDLASLPLGSASEAEAVAAVVAAMEDLGFADVRSGESADRVEGVAETFWFGFKDDVVARIDDRQIDFRSVSRVGVSDLGANAARISKLRDAVAARLNR